MEKSFLDTKVRLLLDEKEEQVKKLVMECESFLANKSLIDKKLIILSEQKDQQVQRLSKEHGHLLNDKSLHEKRRQTWRTHGVVTQTVILLNILTGSHRRTTREAIGKDSPQYKYFLKTWRKCCLSRDFQFEWFQEKEI